MWKIIRSQVPSCLTNFKEWGKEYAINMPKSFNWHGTRSILIEELLKMTQKHCSFCDAFPMQSDVEDTIEHFRPKAIFPLLAYHWYNLFVACRNCQKIPKGFGKSPIKFRKLLKPDATNYSFQKFYYFDTATGTIEIRRAGLSNLEIEKAELTRYYYQWNEFGKPESRLNMFEVYKNTKDCNKRPYRFMFSDCTE